MAANRIIIGTRGSALAIAQSRIVGDELSRNFPDIELEFKKIVTQGDKTSARQIAVQDKGIFTKEIEEALLGHDCDIAVHSLKDMPTCARKGLKIAAVTKRENAQDVLISNNNVTLDGLSDGAVIGTSSLRRSAQLKHLYGTFITKELRGNVDTRIKKLKGGEYDAIILAAAGVIRLGLKDIITQYVPFSVMLPAPGQGALAVQVRSNDGEVEKIAKTLEDNQTRICVEAERSLLESLGGGCEVPISAYAHIADSKVILSGMVASVDGKKVVRLEAEGDIGQPRLLGEKMARDFIAAGAGDILKEIL